MQPFDTTRLTFEAGIKVNMPRTSAESGWSAKSVLDDGNSGHGMLLRSNQIPSTKTPSLSSLSASHIQGRTTIQSRSIPNGVDEKVRGWSAFPLPNSHAYGLGSACYRKGHGAIYGSYSDHNARDGHAVHKGHRRIKSRRAG